MRKYLVYNPYSNQEVTQLYVSIIEDGLENAGCEIEEIDSIPKADGGAGIVVITLSDALKASMKGYKNCVLWVQGAWPEESFMRHHSAIRKRVLDIIEKLAIKRAARVILVSESMRTHLENKHRIRLDNVFIMPCFNDQLCEENFMIDNKYKENIFLYVGNLSNWQCFDKILKMYKFIENSVSNTRLLIYTKEQLKANKLAKKYKIEHYSVDYVKSSELSSRIGCAKFGFVLREDTVVNQVATPTKLSNYLANGIIPIYSSCLDDFNHQIRNTKYAISIDKLVDDEEIRDKVVNSPLLGEINPLDILVDYQKIFESYYSHQGYKDGLTRWLRNE